MCVQRMGRTGRHCAKCEAFAADQIKRSDEKKIKKSPFEECSCLKRSMFLSTKRLFVSKLAFAGKRFRDNVLVFEEADSTSYGCGHLHEIQASTASSPKVVNRGHDRDLCFLE